MFPSVFRTPGTSGRCARLPTGAACHLLSPAPASASCVRLSVCSGRPGALLLGTRAETLLPGILPPWLSSSRHAYLYVFNAVFLQGRKVVF